MKYKDKYYQEKSLIFNLMMRNGYNEKMWYFVENERVFSVVILSANNQALY